MVAVRKSSQNSLISLASALVYIGVTAMCVNTVNVSCFFPIYDSWIFMVASISCVLFLHAAGIVEAVAGA